MSRWLSVFVGLFVFPCITMAQDAVGVSATKRDEGKKSPCLIRVFISPVPIADTFIDPREYNLDAMIHMKENR